METDQKVQTQENCKFIYQYKVKIVLRQSYMYDPKNEKTDTTSITHQKCASTYSASTAVRKVNGAAPSVSMEDELHFFCGIS